jgi:prephenate dehydrogenase
MLKQIAIIGAGGRMGIWFSRYLKGKAVTLLLHDVNSSCLKQSKNVVVCDNLEKCVRNADLVLVCVPISEMSDTLKKCTPSMKAGAILAEISSLKGRSFKQLKKASKAVQPLCIHPMFGPAVNNLGLMKIILVPVIDESVELRILEELFKGATIGIIRDPKLHDKLMATILGLTYFTNLAFANFISKQDYRSLKKFSGTTFRIQSMLSMSVLIDDPDLIFSLLSENYMVSDHIHKFMIEAEKLVEYLVQKDRKKVRSLLEEIRSIYQRNNLEESYANIYRMMSSLNKNEGVVV